MMYKSEDGNFSIKHPYDMKNNINGIFMCKISPLYLIIFNTPYMRWRCGHTLTSHLCGQRFKPQTLCGKDGSFLPDGRQFTVQNLDQLYVLVSSAN